MTTAALGFQIDSSGAKGASVDLDALTAAAQRAEKAEQGLGRASREAQGGVRSLVSAVQQLTEAENRAAGSQFAERRARDIAAYGQELDRLRAKFSPIFAASKAYETSLDELNRAHRVGAVSTREYEGALERLNAEFAMVQSGAMRGAAGLGMANTAMRQSGQMSRQLMFQMVDLGQTIPLALQSPIFALQNMGFQFAQIGQLYFGQGGTRAALRDMGAMEAGAARGLVPDEASVLAIAAAIPIAAVAIAAVTAVVGGAIASFFSGGDAAEEYADSLDRVREATDDLRGFNDLRSDLDALRDKYGQVTAEVGNLIQAQRQLALEQQRRAAQEQIRALGQFVGEAVPRPTIGFSLLSLGDLAAFGELQDFLDAIGEAEGFKAQADAVAEMREHLEGSPELIEAMGDKAHEFRAMIISAEDALRQAAVEAGEVPRPLEDAETAANRLAGNLGGATRNASSLANELQRGAAALAGMARSAQDQLAEAQIRLRFQGDPVGEARALAQRETGQDIADFQSVANELGIPSGMRDQMLEPMKDYARETVEAEAETARLNERVAELNKSTKSGTSETEKRAEAYADLIRSGQQFIAEQEIEAQALGMTEEAAQRLRNAFDMFTQAQQAGIDLTATQAAEIRDLAAAMAEAEAETARATFMDNASASASEFIAEKEMEVRALGMSEEAARRMRLEYEFLNEAQREGIELTPQQVARLEELAAGMARVETATERLKDMTEFTRNTTLGFFDDLKQGLASGESAWEAFKNAGLAALDAIINKMIEMMEAQSSSGGSSGGGLFGTIANAAIGIFGGAVGGGGPTASAVSAAVAGGGGLYAKGGAFSGGHEITAFANGGIVSRPTIFPMANGMGLMGEAGPEAVMPLRRGADGRLGVDAGGGGGGGQPVKIEQTNVFQGTQNTDEVRQMVEEGNRKLMQALQKQRQLDGSFMGVA